MIETHYDEYFAERKWTKVLGKLLIFVALLIGTGIFLHSQYASVSDIIDETGCTVRTEKEPLHHVQEGITTEAQAKREAQRYFDTPLTRTIVNASTICETHYVFKSEKLEGVVVCSDGRILKTYVLCPESPFDALKKANISAVRDITTAN